MSDKPRDLDLPRHPEDWGAPPPDVPRKAPDEEPGFFDRPGRVRKLIIAVFVICGLIAILDPFISKHPHFGIERVFNFYGFYGFVSCVSLVLAAKLLRAIVMRREDYYDR